MSGEVLKNSNLMFEQEKLKGEKSNGRKVLHVLQMFEEKGAWIVISLTIHVGIGYDQDLLGAKELFETILIEDSMVLATPRPSDN